jgi:hypothetical protein
MKVVRSDDENPLKERGICAARRRGQHDRQKNIKALDQETDYGDRSRCADPYQKSALIGGVVAVVPYSSVILLVREGRFQSAPAVHQMVAKRGPYNRSVRVH